MDLEPSWKISNQKKGIALSEAFNAVLIVVLLGVLVIVAIFIFVSLQSTFINFQTLTVTNETTVSDLASINSTTYTVANGTDVCNSQNFAIVQAFNDSGPILLPAANYTINSATGIVKNTTLTEYDNVSLTYSIIFHL